MTTTTSQMVRAHRGAVCGLREAVLVEGPDALVYLQGQMSQDLERLAPNEVAWSLLLHPQGKISAWLRVTRSSHDSFVLDVDRGWADVVVARLERFKLRTDCTISVAPWASVTVAGAAAFEVEIEGAEFEVEGSWAGVPTRDAFGPDLVIADDELVPAEVLDAVRVEAGVPRMGSELDESTIPAAAGIVDQSVSFTKGCYTGQELVARIDSRGNNVPRRLVGLVLEGVEMIAVGSPILALGSDDEVGVVTSVAMSGVLARVVCMGYVKRSVELHDQVRLGSAIGEVRPLPLIEG